jgi:glycosyltransferase involved in cell wall biosynthesis
MKVLVTASTLPRWHGDAMPSFVLEQVRTLQRLHPDLELHVLAPHDADAALEEVLDGVRVHRFRYLWPEGLQRLAYPAILPNLARDPWLWLQVPFLLAAETIAIFLFCRRHRPDVIYSHWFMPQAVAGSLAAWLLRIPHVFTSHSSDVAVMQRLPLLGPMLVRAILRQVRACTVVSRRTGEKLRAFFPEPGDWARVAGKVRQLPMGVMVEDFSATVAGEGQAASQRLGLGTSPVVLFLGRLTAKKGIVVLLDAFEELSRMHPEVLLVIAGDGELRADLSRQIVRRSLGERVRMPGFVGGSIRRDYLLAADILVVPSIVAADGDAEGLPVSLLEGLAAGCLCIATDASGADDILTDARDGFLVRHGDPGQLAATLARVLALDATEARAVSVAAQQLAARYDWDRVAEQHFEHLLSPGRT